MASLKRELGFWDAVFIGWGAMIGAGIFVLSGIAAGIAGPAVIVSFMIAGIIAFFNATSSAELAAAMPKSGASYEYARNLISKQIGFLTGWIFSLSKILESAVVALAFGFYFSALLPSAEPKLVALFAIIALTIINYFGIRVSSIANNIMVVAKVGILLLFIALGIGAFNANNFQPFAPFGTIGILQASALLFFAYTGYARITTIGEEIRNPREVIPKAILVSLAGVVVIYILVTATAIGVGGAPSIANSNSPLAAAASLLGNPFLIFLISAGALIATINVLLGDMLASSRTIFAMARGGDLPLPLSKINEQYSVPDNALFLSAALIALLALTLPILELASLTSLTILLYYAITNASALRLQDTHYLYPKAFAWLGLIGCIFLSLFLAFQSWLFSLGLIIAGALYYKFLEAIRKHRAG